jgi:hypothetical protein
MPKKNMPVDPSLLTPCEKMRGEDAEDTRLLRQMLRTAESYITGAAWCPPICEKYLGFGVGGVVAVFLFRFRKRIQGTDDWLWVIAGDLPSAYLVLDDAPDAKSALTLYCQLMEEWVLAVRKKKPLDNAFPVSATPTKEHARMLASRIRFIREEVLPQWDDLWLP